MAGFLIFKSALWHDFFENYPPLFLVSRSKKEHSICEKLFFEAETNKIQKYLPCVNKIHYVTHMISFSFHNEKNKARHATH